jgi:hypothetical protein
MRFDLQDVALRTLILVAGGLAALLLALKGQGARTMTFFMIGLGLSC